jgi:hypothetical protein
VVRNLNADEEWNMTRSARVVISALLLAVAVVSASAQQHKPPVKAPSDAPLVPALKIIQDSLHQQGEFSYFVKGTVYNPHDKAVKNVVIKYYIWKKYMGRSCEPLDGQCGRLQTGGVVTATLKYLPPKLPVDFTATQESANCCADVLPHNEMPAPLVAEITAEWDQ